MNDSELIALHHRHMRRDCGIYGFDKHAATQVNRLLSPHAREGFILWNEAGALNGAALVDREVAWFKTRANEFTWKSYDGDTPLGIRERLIALGAKEEEPSTLLVRSLHEPFPEFEPPPGYSIDPILSEARLNDLLPVWIEAWPDADNQETWLDVYRPHVPEPQGGIQFFVMRHEGVAVATSYLIHEPGNPFALLCGGAVSPAHRHRGLYRALVGHRVALAKARGASWLSIDASPNSAPIAQSLGFVPLLGLRFYRMTLGVET